MEEGTSGSAAEALVISVLFVENGLADLLQIGAPDGQETVLQSQLRGEHILGPLALCSERVAILVILAKLDVYNIVLLVIRISNICSNSILDREVDPAVRGVEPYSFA